MKYDLDERTYVFAKSVIEFIKCGIIKSSANVEMVPQIIRSATSVGANYIEANEALGGKDFLMRMKICRKEAKESVFWLKLLEINDPQEMMR